MSIVPSHREEVSGSTLGPEHSRIKECSLEESSFCSVTRAVYMKAKESITPGEPFHFVLAYVYKEQSRTSEHTFKAKLVKKSNVNEYSSADAHKNKLSEYYDGREYPYKSKFTISDEHDLNRFLITIIFQEITEKAHAE